MSLGTAEEPVAARRMAVLNAQQVAPRATRAAEPLAPTAALSVNALVPATADPAGSLGAVPEMARDKTVLAEAH
jgi:hypothetical protein